MPTLFFRLSAVHSMTRNRALKLHLSIANAPLTVRRRCGTAAKHQHADHADECNPLKSIEHVHTSCRLNTDSQIWFRKKFTELYCESWVSLRHFLTVED
jgi:hypothetical protein